MHSVYGVDMSDPARAARSWRWLHTRIAGLLRDPTTRLHRQMYPATPAPLPPQKGRP